MGVKFTLDGKRAVVALGRANRLAVIDTSTYEVRYILVGQRPWHIAISMPTARSSITANGLSNDLTIVDVARPGGPRSRSPSGGCPGASSSSHDGRAKSPAMVRGRSAGRRYTAPPALLLVLGLPEPAVGTVLAYWRATNKVQTELHAALIVGEQMLDDAVKELERSPSPYQLIPSVIERFSGGRHLSVALLDSEGQRHCRLAPCQAR